MNNLRIILVFVISALVLNCKEDYTTSEKELNSVLSSIYNKTSISYDLDYQMKYFDYPDTTNFTAKTIIIKNNLIHFSVDVFGIQEKIV